MYPDELKYSKEHEWIKADGDTATIGITFHAQNELGDIVYVELPKVGAKFSATGEFGVVESVKTVSTLYSPVGGEVTEVNELLAKSPETVNKDPYGAAWMIKMKMDNPDEVNKLLSVGDYKKLIGA
ncbi:glycine cleavage system protein GcvH [Candidatus Margulisiibacteriota bacterium]